jgi:hypothetical protein
VGYKKLGGCVVDNFLPSNSLMMNSPIVVIPAQPQSNIGEIVIPPSPPRINLVGVAQLLAKTLSLQRKTKDEEPIDNEPLGAMRMSTINPPPQAKLVVKLYHPVSGAQVGTTYEAPVTDLGSTSWEELSIGFTTNQQVKVEAYVINTDADVSKYVWFDDLKIEIADKPTAMVVQEKHPSWNDIIPSDSA